MFSLDKRRNAEQRFAADRCGWYDVRSSYQILESWQLFAVSLPEQLKIVERLNGVDVHADFFVESYLSCSCGRSRESTALARERGCR